MTQPDTPTPDAPAPDAPGPETAAPVAAGEPPAASTPGPRNAGIRYVSERTGAFVDAVVAIAMTLLILPLMETSSELAHGEMTAGQWLEQHAQQAIRSTAAEVFGSPLPFKLVEEKNTNPPAESKLDGLSRFGNVKFE